MSAPTAFQTMFHADWSAAAKKRWVAHAVRGEDRWHVSAPSLVGDTEVFVNSLFKADGPVLAGFDFPIGVPAGYGHATGFADFPAMLEAVGREEWADFYTVAETPEQISHKRPFYPRVSSASSKQSHLLRALGAETIDALRRKCERATPTRRAACALFWTLGGNQVGKAAISGWQQVISPALQRGAKLWPFDGGLMKLAASNTPVLAETYPGEAYGHVGMAFKAGMSKRRQEDRHRAMTGLPAWAKAHDIVFSDNLARSIADGFGPRGDGEDAFDALAGLLGMIEVADGRRAEDSAKTGNETRWEGWILGQTN